MKITNCKLKKSTQRKPLEYFVLEVTARSAEIFDGQVELDESYFGGARKGKRGRGAAGKVAVFGILKRGGREYTIVVNDTKSSTLLLVIKKNIAG